MDKILLPIGASTFFFMLVFIVIGIEYKHEYHQLSIIFGLISVFTSSLGFLDYSDRLKENKERYESDKRNK